MYHAEKLARGAMFSKCFSMLALAVFLRNSVNPPPRLAKHKKVLWDQ